MAQNHIHIVKMGGTIEFIDPAYDNINKEMMKLDTSVEHYLSNLVKPHFTYEVEVVCEKDSRTITQEDLDRLWLAVKSSNKENILVTHGTFTMPNTAKFLEKSLSQGGVRKKIILTGSMVPIAGFATSDAAFNLGYSIASFDNVELGVYISMNGGIFKPDEVKKNPALLRFE